jgi:glycerophosphoryl diester phosphodiesterase
MALSLDRKTLLPLLEKPLVESELNTLLIHPFDLTTKNYTGTQYKYLLDPRGRAIGDFIMYSKDRGLVIERDDTQGDLKGFKAVFDIKLGAPGEAIQKDLRVDLLNIHDPDGLSLAGNQSGDVGVGFRFAFPFVTIEDIVVLNHKHIGVLNDNNFPFSVGRHVGSGEPDDSECIIIRLDRPLGGL